MLSHFWVFVLGPGSPMSSVSLQILTPWISLFGDKNTLITISLSQGCILPFLGAEYKLPKRIQLISLVPQPLRFPALPIALVLECSCPGNLGTHSHRSLSNVPLSQGVFHFCDVYFELFAKYILSISPKLKWHALYSQFCIFSSFETFLLVKIKATD